MVNEIKSKPSRSTTGPRNTTGRYRYFEMWINLGLNGPKADLRFMPEGTLISLLIAMAFVRQLALEQALYQAVIIDRGRQIRFSKFSGQLEKDGQKGIPYWHILLETSSLTTGRCIARYISNRLFSIPKIDPTIKINPVDSFRDMEKEKRFSLDESDWYPGYFSHTTVKVFNLLKRDEVREAFKATPNKYLNQLKENMQEQQ